jgi:hypothetical protein
MVVRSYTLLLKNEKDFTHITLDSHQGLVRIFLFHLILS